MPELLRVSICLHVETPWLPQVLETPVHATLPHAQLDIATDQGNSTNSQSCFETTQLPRRFKQKKHESNQYV